MSATPSRGSPKTGHTGFDPIEFLHAERNGGASITCDEGEVSYSRDGQNGKLTLDEIDEEIADAERDTGG